MSSPSELENLITKMALGDRASFEGLYRATSAKLFGVTLRVLKDRSVAEDALQESYVKIWHNAGRYQVNGLSPMSWLITIARNTAIDHLRKQRSGDTVGGGSDLVDTIADAQPGPEGLLIQKSDATQLDLCLAELKDAHSLAVRGAYLDGKTYAQLAQDANVPLNTMRTWLRRSLLNLRECLSR